MKRSTLGWTIACSLVAADIHARIVGAQRPATDVSGPGLPCNLGGENGSCGLSRIRREARPCLVVVRLQLQRGSGTGRASSRSSVLTSSMVSLATSAASSCCWIKWAYINSSPAGRLARTSDRFSLP